MSNNSYTKEFKIKAVELLEQGHKSVRQVAKEASGLPMVGCLDVNGNSFGANSSSDHYDRSRNDNYHNSSYTTYNSSYDPFTNRY